MTILGKQPSTAGRKSCYSRSAKWIIQRLCLLACGALCLLLCRMKAMGAKLPVFTRADNPAAASQAPVKQLTFAYLIGLNGWLLLSPSQLSCDWTMDTVPLVSGFSDLRNLATLALATLIAGLVWSACLPTSFSPSLASPGRYGH